MSTIGLAVILLGLVFVALGLLLVNLHTGPKARANLLQAFSAMNGLHFIGIGIVLVIVGVVLLFTL